MTTFRPARKRSWLALGALLVVVLARGTALAEADWLGSCLTVRVPAPLWLPDGSRHPAGSLKICNVEMYSPVSALHVVYLDGAPLEMIRSRLGRGGEPTTDPYVEFLLDSSGSYRLVGCGWPEGSEAELFTMLPATMDIRMSRERAAASERSDSLQPILLTAAVD